MNKRNIKIGIIILFLSIILLNSCNLFNSRVTRENYDKILTGMTKQQVIEILGEPFSKEKQDLSHLIRGYSNVDVWTFINLGTDITIRFVSGQVWIKLMNGIQPEFKTEAQ